MRQLLLFTVSLGALTAANFSAAQAQSETDVFTYDSLGRLITTEVTGGTGTNNGDTRTMCYDAMGNRTEVKTREDGSVPACPNQPPSQPPPPSPPPSPPPPPPPSNNPPVAVDDSASGECSSVQFVNLVANDSDPDGDTPLNITSIVKNSGGASATLINPNFVEVIFGPQFDISTFTYTLSDPSGATDSATLTVSTSMCIGGGGGLPPP